MIKSISSAKSLRFCALSNEGRDPYCYKCRLNLGFSFSLAAIVTRQARYAFNETLAELFSFYARKDSLRRNSNHSPSVPLAIAQAQGASLRYRV